MNATQQNARPAKGRKGISTIILVIALAALCFWGSKRYNALVNMDEGVNKAWSMVENQYQRRADLIPNLVNVVKGYAAHEKETLEGVIKARAQATQVKIDPQNMTQEQLQAFQSQQDQLSQALGKLMVVIERYPELKADRNFLQLQAQLEETENRITLTRDDFNNAANSYNVYVRKFPNNIVAGIFGFHQRPYFKAMEGSEKAPTVTF